jgi:hypothetical protein
VQQFANNFIGMPVHQPSNGEDSESSNLNSHRRCKSQNVKRDRNEANGSSIAKKSIDRSKVVPLVKSQNKQYLIQDIS